ncbi:MAG: HAMP domain-containing histidine kinase, partial [Gelidibacter sp.]|nr:HAMP domain-containing histidine kinase [Gelidibacter sp.]
MSLSLIGIIFVQVYFINNSLQNEKRQFTLNVKRSLSFVSSAIEDREFQNYATKMHELIASGVVADSINLKELIVRTQDDAANQTIVYKSAILEESYKVPSLFFDIGLDSISISRLTNQRETVVYDNNALDGNLRISPVKTIREFSTLSELEKKLYELQYREQYKNYPIYKRISTNDVERLLLKQLKDDGIETNFEFAIYDKDLATKVQSSNFELDKASTYGVPIFLDNHNESNYKLYVDFPNRNKYLFNTIIGMTLLSILFTMIIIFAFASAIYQIIKQRQISQIKTDFINNMTHEFKTPIATINLALDSIRNPKIIGDQEKVLRYLKMIKDENKRMHAQVENVLRISKLERNELNISKDRVSLHDLIEDAITHVELIVEDRQGYVKTHFEADKASVLANETHFTNVIVNMLDNAIKYS